MTDRFHTVSVHSYSTGTPGRSINNARSNHFVIDDPDYVGGPNQALTAGETFFSGVTACAVLMIERLARERSYPLKWVDVFIEGTRDVEATHEVHAVYDKIEIRVELAGLDELQAHELVEIYKRR